jgi:hypothetical protein
MRVLLDYHNGISLLSAPISEQLISYSQVFSFPIRWVLNIFQTFQKNIHYVYLEGTMASFRRHSRSRVSWLT